MSTYLAGCLRVATGGTLRVVWTPPVGPAVTVDVVVPAGTWCASHRACLAELQAALVAGAPSAGFLAYAQRNSQAQVESVVSVASGTFSWTWSHAGSLTDLRGWLGASGNVTGQTSWTMGFQVAAWAPQQEAQRFVRTVTTRSRAAAHMLDGSHVTQHATVPGGADSVRYRLAFWAGNEETDVELVAFSSWLDELEALGCGQVFSVESTAYDTEVRTMAWDGDEVRLTWTREPGHPLIWRCDCDAVGVDLGVAP